jgi:type II secretory pathway pseudopilin PulG
MMRPRDKMRPGFSMITAIFVIVIMASVGAFVMNLSGKMVKETTTQYRHEQAILYAKSYTEFAIMAATAEPCTNRITADVDGNANDVEQGQGYRVVVDIRYIGNNDPNACANTVGEAVNYANSLGGTILIDTYVRYRDPEDPRSTTGITWANNKGFTYHRRTLQRL